MQKRKQRKIQTLQKPILTNRLEFISDDRLRLAIPVGTPFQANVPHWTGSPHKKYPRIGNCESDTSKWLGTRTWPIKDRSPETKRDVIGKGRPDFCPCVSPGSVECVKQHVTDKRIQLQVDLGPAFWNWKFDEMGEIVSGLWNLEEQKKFESLVKMNPISKGKSFLKPALESLPSQSKENIVRYYFNVYLPNRISTQIRSGCTFIDTDDEAEEAPYSKGTRKRSRADRVTSYNSKFVKTKFLTGHR